MSGFTKTRIDVLCRVEEDVQSFRIARQLGISRTSVSSALQWLRLAGFVTYESGWMLTKFGKLAARDLHQEPAPSTASLVGSHTQVAV